MRLVPCEPAHLGAISPGRFELAATEGFDVAGSGPGLRLPGPAFTVLGPDGAPLGAGGIVPLWRGVGTGWLYAADALRARPVALHRAVARGLAAAEAGLGLRRVQVSVHAEFSASRRWVERLGFAFESAMPGYGRDGATYDRYAKVTNHVR